MKKVITGLAAITGMICMCCILAGLWNKKEESLPEQGSGRAYVPEFYPCKMPCDNISRICSNGKEFYLLGDVGEERQIREGEETIMVYEYRTGVFRISPDGTEVKELKQYRPLQEENKEDSNVYVSNLTVDGEGKTWVTEQVTSNRYDLPDHFDETVDDKLNYLTDVEINYIFRQLDSEGREVKRTETGNLMQRTGLDNINDVMADWEGDIYVLGGEEILVMDEKMNIQFSLKDKKLQGEMFLCAGGNVVVSSLDGEGNRILKRIDKQSRKWGKEYVLPANANRIYSGSGKYFFLYENGDSLYGLKEKETEGEKILSWSSVDINRDSVLSFCPLEDGRIAVVNCSEDGSFELILLTEKDLDSLEKKTVLTYATLQLDYSDRMRIIKFNKQNKKYRIDIRDYSELNMEGDPQAGFARLNADMMSGNIPDILGMENLPLRQYAQKGLLEDLWPYIERDNGLGRNALMERVLQAAETDGKLYRIFDSFSVNTVVGAQKTVGASSGWRLKDLLASLDTMENGCQIFGKSDTKQDILHRILEQNLESYINWTTGKCDFDSESFISALKFCNTFPMQYQEQNGEYDFEFNRIAEGRQMLLELNLSDFDYVQLLEGLFRGEITYVGYPREDEKSGSSFGISSTMAMTSSCRDKEGAWQFMREMLLPQSTENENYYPTLFPVNKEDFMAIAKRAMKKDYQVDENGSPILDEKGQPMEAAKGGWILDNMEIDIYAMRQEQFDKFMALYNSIDTISGSDEIVQRIIDEEAAMYFHGDKTAEQTAEVIQNRVSLYVSEQR